MLHRLVLKVIKVQFSRLSTVVKTFLFFWGGASYPMSNRVKSSYRIFPPTNSVPPRNPTNLSFGRWRLVQFPMAGYSRWKLIPILPPFSFHSHMLRLGGGSHLNQSGGCEALSLLPVNQLKLVPTRWPKKDSCLTIHSTMVFRFIV